MATITTDTALLRLLQLASPTLPVGGYAFSQGLEYAIEAGWLNDSEEVGDWLRQQLCFSLARVDAPLLLRQHQAATAGDTQAQAYYNAYTLACRETAELRLTDTAMGEALLRLLRNLDVPLPPLAGDTSYITAFACAAVHWQIDADLACHGYLWSWLENQIAAATKLVPLGQTAAQQLLGELLPELQQTLTEAKTIEDHNMGGSLPGLATASCRHEIQYSRLFRS
jgi:urease accessory protein